MLPIKESLILLVSTGTDIKLQPSKSDQSIKTASYVTVVRTRVCISLRPCSITPCYSTAQFKVDRARMWHGLNITRFSFYVHVRMRVHIRLMTLNLLFKALVYALDMGTIVCRRHAHTKFGLCACEL